MTHRILRKPIETIPGLAEELAAKAAAVHGHDIEDVSGLADALGDKAPADHGHVIGDIDELAEALDGKADAVHSHDIDDVTGLADALGDKAPADHAHVIGDIYDLYDALDGKAAAVHSHTMGDVTGLSDTLDGKADAVHTHDIADVSGLQTALNGKAASSHNHAISEVTGLQTALDLKADLIGGVIPSSQLPALVKTDVKTVANEAAMLALTAQSGDIAIRPDITKTFVHNGGESGTTADWSELISPTDAVTSVNGLIGNITLGYGDVGAAAAIHYHAIADVSGLQTALDGKAASSHTHTISDLTDLPTISATSLANAIVKAGTGGKISDDWLSNLVDPLRAITLGTSAANKVVTADASGFVGIGLAPVSGHRFAASSIYCLNQALFNGIVDVGDVSTDVPHIPGGMYFARSGANEPFIRGRSNSGGTIGSQIRFMVGGGVRFTSDGNEAEWGRVTSTGFSTALRILSGSGSAADPTYSFGVETGTGIYRSGTNTLDFATGAARRAYLNAGGLTLITETDQGAFRWVGNSGFGLRIQNTGTGGADYRIGVSSSLWAIGGGAFIITPDNTSANSVLTIRNGFIGLGSSNVHPKATVHGIGSTILGAATAAVADTDMGNGQINLYLDESGHNLKVKAKYSNGTIRTATIALVA